MKNLILCSLMLSGLFYAQPIIPDPSEPHSMGNCMNGVTILPPAPGSFSYNGYAHTLKGEYSCVGHHDPNALIFMIPFDSLA